MANLIPKFNTSLVAKNKTAIVKADKFLGLSKSEKIDPGKIAKYSQNEIKSEYNQELLLTIEKKVIGIDKFLKDSLFLQRKDAETKRRKGEDKKFVDKENEFEKKKPKISKGKIKLPSLPKLGIFDIIKNFIVNTFLGFLAVRLIDFLPQLLKIVPIIIKVGDFLIDIAGKMLDGLITIIDWGYKAIDATRGFVGKTFGDDALKNFDKLGGLIDTFLNLAIIAGMLSIGKDTKPGFGKGKNEVKPKPGKGGRPKVTTSGGGGQGKPDIRNPLRERPPITQGRGGRGGFRLPEFFGGKPKAKVTTGGGGGAGKLRLPKGLKNRGGLLGLVMLIPDLIESGMLVSQGRGKDGLRTFLSSIAGVGAGLIAASAVTAGAAALGITGVGIPAAIALAVAGFGASYLASSAAFNLADVGLRKMGLVDTDPKTNKPYEYAGGGSTTPSTRGGKRVNSPAKRYIRGAKSTRTLAITQRKVKPGSKIGGKDKLEQLFPDTKNPSGNIITNIVKTGSFIGNWISSLFGGGRGKQPSQPYQTSQNTQDKKPKVPQKMPNPLEFLVKASDTLGKADFFGPIFSLATKTLLGDKPGKLDYLNVGVGLNSWLNQTMNFGAFAFAEGGEVDARNFMVGEDYSNVIAKSVENSVSSEVNQSIQDLMKQLMIQKVSPEESDEEMQLQMQEKEIKEKEQPGLDPGLEPGQPGSGVNVSGGNADFWSLVAIASREDSDPQAWADIAQSIYNRAATGMYSGGKSIKAIINASGQYEPTFSNPKEWKAISDLASAAKASGKSQAYLQRVAAAIKNPQLQAKAASFVGGRSDFMGETQKGAMKSNRGDVTRGPGDNYFGWFYNAKLKGPAKAPALGNIKIMAGSSESRGRGAPGETSLGKGYGSGGGKIAGELGRFIKRKLKSPDNFSVVHRHPEHPPYSLTSGHSQGSLHYQGRAVDIGAYTREQGPILRQIALFNKERGVKPVELYHGRNEPRGHYNHVHVAYEKGGETLDGPHQALIGEKGKEYVIDADSYKATEKVVPGLLDILNYDVNGKASLIKYMPNIIASLRKYAPYEDGAESVIVMSNMSSPASVSQGSDQSGAPIISGGSVNRNMQFEDTLMYG